MPGWYPDPGGERGRFRYWDGQGWSAQTSADPASGPPGGAAAATSVGRRAPWIVAAALLLVVVIVAAVVIGGNRDLTTTDPTDPLPSSSVSGGNDSTPTPTPAPSELPSTPPASPSATPSAPPATPTASPCPVGDPTARNSYPPDGRVHGGFVSFPEQPGWSTDTQSRGMSWAYDVGDTSYAVEPRWYAMYAVGALSTADGFETPQRAAELAMECTASSNFYQGFTGRRDLSSTRTKVGSYPAWTLRSEIRVDSNETTFAGDVVQITVVDLGSPESLAFFWGCAPIGDEQLIAQLARTAAQLRVD